MPVLILLVITFLMTSAPADAAKRLALIIGNDTYSFVPKLAKARSDARAMAETMTGLGFETITAFDADRRGMNRAITSFTSRLEPGDTAMVFYAGHGVEIDGENHLLPIDIAAAENGNADFIRFESIALSDLLRRIQATGARTTLVFLDACRDNPFAASSLGRSIGGARGLARITAPEGTFVVYSAGAGQQALDSLAPDDPNPNSVFTRLLLPKLKRPGLELRQLISELRIEVRDLAKTRSHAQFPAYYDELLGQFFFAAPKPLGIAGSPQPEPEAKPKAAAGDIHKDFELARSINTPEAYRVFLERYGARDDAVAVGLARQMLENFDENAPPVQPVETATFTPAPANSGRQLQIDNAALTREIIRETQAALNARGCRAGPADGIMGNRTRAAFDDFLAATGVVLSAGSLGTEAALNAVRATNGVICKPAKAKQVAAPKPKTKPQAGPKSTTKTAAAPAAPKPKPKPTPAATVSLTGTWSGKSSCHPAKRFRLRYRKTSANTYRETARIAGDPEGTVGTVRVNGRKLSAKIKNLGLPDYPNSWNATFSTSGKSYSGTDDKGCKITRSRIGN